MAAPAAAPLATTTAASFCSEVVLTLVHLLLGGAVRTILTSIIDRDGLDRIDVRMLHTLNQDTPSEKLGKCLLAMQHD